MIEVGVTERDFLSGEPVEGELLSAALAAGRLPAEDALRIAIELGTQLHGAHLRGLVHGSVSPQTVALTKSGLRLLRPRDLSPDAAAPYRSPEQVRGAPPDWRSDIFAYGAVLYELASGTRAFAGTGPALDRAILEDSPAPLMAKTPVTAAFEGVIAGCLEKDPARRRQRVQNAVIELKLAGRARARTASRRRPTARYRRADAISVAPLDVMPQAAPPEYFVESPKPPNGFRRSLMTIVLATVAVAASGLAAALYLQKPTQPVLKFSVSPPEHTSYPGTPAVSPDGLSLTFSAVGPEGHRMLWLRSFDKMHAEMIPGTDGGFAPFWSPDSQHIAFFANKTLKQVHLLSDLADVKPETICDADADPGGGAWNKDGTIVFAPSMSDGLYRVPAAGGRVEKFYKLDTAKGERAQLWPQFLPDGKHFLFLLLTSMTETTGVYAGSLDSQEKRYLFASQTNAVYSPAAGESGKKGYLLYIKGRDLVGQGFNASRLEVNGGAMTLANDIGSVETLSLAPVSVSRNAVLVYQTVAKPTRQLVWMDRSGGALGNLGEAGDWGPPKVSPDGKRVAVGKVADEKNAEIWILDDAGNQTVFQSEPGVSQGSPVWSPDGARIAFWSNAGGIYDLFMKSVAAGAHSEPIYRSPYAKYPTDWSHDGRYIIFGEVKPGTGSDVLALNMSDRRAVPLVNTIYSEGYAALSPNGKWLAYQSDDSGRNEVYVQKFDSAPGTKRRWKVSLDGGGLPKWRGDGSEIFYLTLSGTVFAAAVRPGGDEFQFDPPQPLFTARPIPKTWNLYDVSPDGQRFIMNLPLEWSNSSLITVITNWTEKLKS